MNIKKYLNSRRFLPPIIILGSILLTALLIVFSKSPPKAPPQSRAPTVEVLSVKPETRHIVFSGYGTVTPKQAIELRSQVSGEIVEAHPMFQEGGRINKGETILKIDPRDYEVALEKAKADLARAEFELKLEQANQVVAKKEWELLKKDLKKSGLGEDLALRKPHILEKEAMLRAAKSQLTKAKLDLERTNISAPYDTVIIERHAELGKYISSQTDLASIAGTDTFQVIVKLPRDTLDYLAFSGNSDVYDSKVKVFQSVSDSRTFIKQGKLVRFLGNVDRTGRMAQVLVEINNPLDQGKSKTPLLIGSYVKVQFKGKKISDVYQIPRNALRAGSTVWTAKDSTLKKVEVNPIFSKGDDLFVKAALGEEAKIITTNIKHVLEGMSVRLASSIKSKNTKQG